LNKIIKLFQNNASNVSQIAPNNNDRCIVIGTDANQFNFATTKILSVKSTMFSHHNVHNFTCLSPDNINIAAKGSVGYY
jgi:hypothetical protein